MNLAKKIAVTEERQDEAVDWVGSLSFFAVHIAALFIFFVGFSWTALLTCVALYVVRMFAITGGYHRYFSHRAFKTSRFFQFFLGFLGTTAAQTGPLWWAAHHRHHHRFSDKPEDIHSPVVRSLFWSHMGWILCKRYETTDYKAVPDLTKYPELMWLNRFHVVGPIVLATAVFGLGIFFEAFAPGLQTNRWQMLVWGFFFSTMLLYHGTFTINSLSHKFGSRRYETDDDSRNNVWLAIITLGEGWHNNHHRYPHSERQGFFWWEIDITHLILKSLSKIGIVWDLKTPPADLLKRPS